jgi:hypothetical protein
MKLNVLLALTDQLRIKYKGMVNDYSKYFSKSQGAFKGEKRTYTAREGVIDDPSKRGITRIATTVNEKIDFFIKESSEFVDALFSQEKTNSMGLAKAELEVNGVEWGEFTSLELLRFKSILESSDLGNLENLISNIPVRSDSEVWNKSADSDYEDRDVFETEKITGVNKTTVKTPYVLEDPNLKGKEHPQNYSPPVVTRDEIMELGDYTKQNFSGEWSHRQRSLALKRRSDLLSSIVIALKKANECDSTKSELTAEKIFTFIFKGE